MSSRFVPAGTDQAPVSGTDDWTKARQEVESQRQVKSTEIGKQEDGKSLYEVLQANKAAKQDAFEEASKLRNQFRSLDDSEVEFLDSIRESERLKETSVRQETAEQLDLFRRQQAAAEQAAVDPDSQTKATDRGSDKTLWTTSKKRRRDKNEVDVIPSKSRKQSGAQLPEQEESVHSVSSSGRTTSITDKSQDKAAAPLVDIAKPDTGNESNSTGLGLFLYTSDDDDD